MYHIGPGDNTNIMQLSNERNNTINQENHKLSLAWALWRRSPRHG